jgi:hypothetical protein
MSAWLRVKVGEHAPYVVLIEDRDGAGNESTGSHFASERRTRSRDGRQQKKWRPRRGCGKDAGWKSQKPDFPTPLGNPANPAGFPLSHSLGDCGRLTKTGHLICYAKRDISNVVRRGTFLMSVDTQVRKPLTRATSGRTIRPIRTSRKVALRCEAQYALSSATTSWQRASCWQESSPH